MDPAPFLRGVIYPGVKGAPYPRAKPGDGRIPGDTWYTATFPVGVRLELTGDARAVEIAYEGGHEYAIWPGEGGRSFEVWRHGAPVSHEKAHRGEHTVTLAVGEAPADERAIVYLPERMQVTIRSVTAIDGSIEPAAAQRRWICHGDSISEGWVSSEAAYSWPAIAGRQLGLNVLNMGYAGAARGELVTAEQIAELGGDVITIAFGTNCWSRIAQDAPLIRENTRAFLDVVRRGHPETPVVVLSMLLRPEGEDTPNAMGATHHELRLALEDAVRARIDAGDANLHLVGGRDLIDDSMLADNVHPNDAGHRAVASAMTHVLRGLL